MTPYMDYTDILEKNMEVKHHDKYTWQNDWKSIELYKGQKSS